MDVVARIVWDMWLVLAFALNAYWFGAGERNWLVYVGLVCCGLASIFICIKANR